MAGISCFTLCRSLSGNRDLGSLDSKSDYPPDGDFQFRSQQRLIHQPPSMPRAIFFSGNGRFWRSHSMPPTEHFQANRCQSQKMWAVIFLSPKPGCWFTALLPVRASPASRLPNHLSVVGPERQTNGSEVRHTADSVASCWVSNDGSIVIENNVVSCGGLRIYG